MISGFFVINMGDGIMLRLPATQDTKNYGDDGRKSAGEHLATVLGGDYVCWEDAE